jgi:DNA-binding GntR family transcriptional regulator
MSGTEETTARRSRTSPQTLVDYAAGQLRESILSREFAPGEWIRLDALADSLGMSPIPLREALRMLASEGLMVQQPHRGYVVASASVADLQETYRLRLVLEPLAVKLAVPQLTDADIAELEKSVAAMTAAFDGGDWAAYREHHRAFHFAIYNRSGSKWVVRFSEMLWLNAQRYQRMMMEMKGEFRRRNQEHKALLQAARARNAEEAATLMHDHLERALEAVETFLTKNPELVGPPLEVEGTEPKSTSKQPRSR